MVLDVAEEGCFCAQVLGQHEGHEVKLVEAGAFLSSTKALASIASLRLRHAVAMNGSWDSSVRSRSRPSWVHTSGAASTTGLHLATAQFLQKCIELFN